MNFYQNCLPNIPKLHVDMINHNSEINGFVFRYTHHGSCLVVDENNPKLSKSLKKYYKILLIFWKPHENPLQLVANRNGFANLNGDESNVRNEIMKFFNIKSSFYGKNFNLKNFYNLFNGSIRFTERPVKALSNGINHFVGQKDNNYYEGRNYCIGITRNNGTRSQINSDNARLHCWNLYKYIIPRATHGAKGISFLFSKCKKDERSPYDIIKSAFKRGIIGNMNGNIPNTNN